MILIGEELNVMSKTIGQGIKDRDAGPIRECIAEQVKNKMDYLDLNVGPVKKDPVGTMEWLVKTVQEITDTPLCLDTTNVAAMEAGLKICKKKPILNSASGSTDSRQTMMPLAAKYPCSLVLSVINDTGLPSDAEERAASIMDSVAYANEIGIASEDIWVDPVMMPVSVDQRQVAAYMEFVQMLPDIVPGAKSLCGLSNLSFGVPKELRGLLNRTFLVMLDRIGQHSAIVSGYDEELSKLMNGGLPGIVKLIHRTMDAEDIDVSSLSDKERQYVKTAEVLMGRSLFSSSWLEV
ncbi:MAG: dihydropteroate synthase [Syntrophobacteraceae bacterium]|jgi:5-methyltetrahydrofolate corrinoid/iron sulfur protein methyltransferase